MAAPRAIGLDMYFDRPTEPDKDEAVLHAIREARSPVTLTALKAGTSDATGQFRDAFIARAERPVAYAESDFDLDVPVRRISPGGESAFTASFPELFVETAGTQARAYAGGRIDWLGLTLDGSAAFLTLKAEDVLGGDRQQQATDLLRDKLVLVGSTGVTGLYKTPLSVVSNERMPKAAIDAHVTAQILDARRIVELSPRSTFLINVALCAFFFLIT